MRITLFLILVGMSTGLLGQGKHSAPIKWGKIQATDLAFTEYELDPEAEAVVLCDFGILRTELVGDGYKYRLNRTRRIKILKESGLDRGNISIPYYHHQQYERISVIEVQVFTPDGGKQSLSKKEIYDERKNEYWSSKNFSVPNLQVGSVFEYHYEIISEDLTNLREWTFQEDLPIRHSELQIQLIPFFEYIYLINGEALQTAMANREQRYRYDHLEVVSTTNPFILKNIPAIKAEERFVTCMEDYTLSIRFQLSKVNYPDGTGKPHLTSWPMVAQELYEGRYLGQQYRKARNYKKMLAPIQESLEAAATQAERVEIAAQYLRSNLKSNGRFGYSASQPLDVLFNKQEVNSGQGNLMLMALLQAVGVDVYPLLVSTRSNGRMIEHYPIVDQFNHLMVYAVVDGKEQILDLGDPQRPLTMPRVAALNKRAWLVNGEHSKWIDLAAAAARQVLLVELRTDEEGTMVGEIKGMYDGYQAVQERRDCEAKAGGQYWQERLRERFPDAEVSDFDAERLSEVNRDFRNSFSCRIPEAVQGAGNLKYVPPVLYSEYDQNPFKLEKRNYPVDIPFPLREQYIGKIQIPEGYEIDHLPEELHLKLPEEGATYHFSATREGSTVQVVANLHLHRLEYGPEDYPVLKEFFDRIIAKMEDFIIFKKIS